MTKYSIIIPAFNEEELIGALLTALSVPEILRLCEIIVVCNGCDDRTHEISTSFKDVTTAESRPGKSNALNKGDQIAGDLFPRLYMDADVQISPESVLLLLRSLDTSSVRAAAPVVQYATENYSFLVRRWSCAHETIPRLVQRRLQRMDGGGLYGVSRAGRGRFGLFPDIRADDTFFFNQFTPDERILVKDALAVVRPAKTVRQLIRTQTRIVIGNRELALLFPSSDFEPTPNSTKWIASWRKPQLINVMVWIGVAVVVRLRIFAKRNSEVREPWR